MCLHVLSFFWWLVVVSCCQANVQEMSSSMVVVFVQPGRAVRGLFAFVISLNERLQIEGRAGLISYVCSQALG